MYGFGWLLVGGSLYILTSNWSVGRMHVNLVGRSTVYGFYLLNRITMRRRKSKEDHLNHETRKLRSGSFTKSCSSNRGPTPVCCCTVESLCSWPRRKWPFYTNVGLAGITDYSNLPNPYVHPPSKRRQSNQAIRRTFIYRDRLRIPVLSRVARTPDLALRCASLS